MSESEDPREWSQMVLAVDPGDAHHGLVMAALRPDSTLITGAWELDSDADLFDRMERWSAGGGLAHLVLEEFRLYPWQARTQGFSDFPTPQAIGVLRYLARRYRVPVTMQKAAIKKDARKLADARGVPMKIRSLGSGKGAYRGPDFDAKWLQGLYGVRSSQHIRDALAHLCYWAWTHPDAPARRVDGPLYEPPTLAQMVQGRVLYCWYGSCGESHTSVVGGVGRRGGVSDAE